MAETITLPAELTPQMWAACGDAVVRLPGGGTVHHDKVTEAVWEALKKFACKADGSGANG